MKVTREFKVGLIFVISVAILYWGVNYLKGTDVFSSQRIIYGVYSNTNGLSGGRPVTLNGKQVGQVKSIEFTEDLSGRLIVAMNLTTEYPIPVNSRATITGDLLGNKQVDLIMGNSQEVIQNGDTIATEVRESLSETVNRQIAPLKNKAEKLLGSLDTAITIVQSFLTPEAQEDFKSTFTNLSSTFEHLNNISANADLYMSNNLVRLDKITRNLDDITTTISANRGQLEKVFNNLNALSDTLARARVGETMAQLSLATRQASEIMTRINRGEGTAGKLINDEELYNNLNKASESLDRLLLDMRYNPNRYVEFSIFGSRTRYTQKEIDALEEERLKEANEN